MASSILHHMVNSCRYFSAGFLRLFLKKKKEIPEGSKEKDTLKKRRIKNMETRKEKTMRDNKA